MEIQQLRRFYYSAKLGSLTKAAQKLSITQSAVSQQIKALEDEMNTKLFNRFGPRKELTPDGEIFIKIITPIIREFDSIIANFNDRKGSQKGQLTIASTTVIIMGHLPYVVKKYSQLYPQVQLTILEHRWNDIVALTESGDIDFGIAPIKTIPNNLSYIELPPMDRVLITSLDHPLSKKKQITLQDIAKYPMITYEKGLVHRAEFDRVFENVNLSVEIIMEATNAETIIRYVEIGIGVAVIPQIALFPTKTHRLKVISVNRYFGKSHYGVILRKGKVLTSWAKNFLSLLSSETLTNL